MSRNDGNIESAHARIGEALCHISRSRTITEQFYSDYLGAPGFFTADTRDEGRAQLAKIKIHLKLAMISIEELGEDSPFG